MTARWSLRRHGRWVYFKISMPVISECTMGGMQTRFSDENSVRPPLRSGVRLSNACIVTKRKKNMSRILYYTKDHLA